MSTAYVIQKPRNPEDFDLDAIQSLGKIEYILPAPPNIHDGQRFQEDIEHISNVIDASGADDCFITLSGSPWSNILFGVAWAQSDTKNLTMAIYSRGRDKDGRRGGEVGSYRKVPVSC
ncbi:MAG: hypothetical protein COY40_04955 [Alphaproteobacteria bacterium CG_4_10_14_0_8_um_filter_53_9]|nr:MAG: hypothetical protein COY40_04955 [Alphaproteobacteria bacterium CG_4_10_14_0_8_um_filter_53_9]